MKRILSFTMLFAMAVANFFVPDFQTISYSAEVDTNQYIFFKADFDDSYFGATDSFDNCQALPDGNSITTSVDSDGNRYMVYEKYAPDYSFPHNTNGDANFRKTFTRVNTEGVKKITFQFDIMPVSVEDNSKIYIKAEDTQNYSDFIINAYKIGDKSVLSDGLWTTISAVYNFSADQKNLTVYADGVGVLKKKISIDYLWQASVQAYKIHPACVYNFDNFYIYSGEPVFEFDKLSEIPYASMVYADKTNVSSDIAAISQYGDYIINGSRNKDELLVTQKNGEIYISISRLAALLNISETSDEYLPWNDALSRFGIDAIFDDRGFVYWSVSNYNLVLSSNEIWNIYNTLVYDRPDSYYLVSNAMKTHPRLNLTNDALEKIKRQIHESSYAKNYFDKAMSFVDEYYNSEPIDCMIDTGSVMMKARTVLNRVQNLSLYYLITGKEEYKNRVWEEIAAVIDEANFPHWQPDSGLDNAEMAAAIAYAYDWLYNDWDMTQRKLLEEALYEKALKYADMYYGAQIGSEHSWWINSSDTNHNAVDNGGYILASISVIDKYPSLAGRVLERAIRSMEKYQNSFYPDGGWKEGVTYWVYAMSYWSPAICSLINSYGTDFGLSHSPGMEKSFEFILYACGIGANNFHDSGSEEPIYHMRDFYNIAKIYNRPDIADIKLTYDVNTPRRQGLDILINFPDSACVMEKLDFNKDAVFERIGMVSMRENWLDRNSMFLSFHGGDAMPNHGHWDTGSFVYEYGGVRFAVDLPSESYSFDDMSQVYRGRAEGHNCLVINPDLTSGQQKDVFSPVEIFESGKYGAYSVIDMTDSYSPYAAMIRRGFKTENNRNSVIIRDELEEVKTDSDIYWFMHITDDTEVKINSDAAYLTKSGVSVKLEFVSNLENEQISLSSAEPMKESPNPPGQSDNSNYRKITIKGIAPGGSNAFIQVKISPVSQDISPMKNMPIESWSNPDFCSLAYNTSDEVNKVMAEIAKTDKFAFIAIYDDGELTKIIPAVNNSYDGMSVSSDIPYGKEVSASVFVWESKENIAPLMAKIPLSVTLK